MTKEGKQTIPYANNGTRANLGGLSASSFFNGFSGTAAVFIAATMLSSAMGVERTFPGSVWASKTPAEVALDEKSIGQIAETLGGRGCVVRHGYMVATWGSQSRKSDWMSSSKPVLSTLLFFAIQEGKAQSVDTRIRDYGWELAPKDQTLSFHHLANMISGYARPEPPGEAWAYNDYAISLYHKTVFEKVFKGDPCNVANDPSRLGFLQFEDGLSFGSKGRMVASVRDFARICWFWSNAGKWNDKQLLSRKFFDEYAKPQVPKNLPHTAKAETNDYLKIGTYGGGSDHFTVYGPGIYGYNFWFNNTGRDHPDRRTWPDAPPDTFMTIGAGGNSSIIIPSLDMFVAAGGANWGNLEPGNPDAIMNKIAKLAVEASKQ